MMGYSKREKMLENVFNIFNMKQEDISSTKTESQNYREETEIEGQEEKQ